MNPIISIIIPSFNKEFYISQTINSVLNQNYRFWELLIIDDCSTDKTITILNTYAEKDSRVKVCVNSENKGANYCRNLGIKNALGKFVVFLDADDLLSAGCVGNRVSEIQNTNLDFIVFTMQVFSKIVGDSHMNWKPNSSNPLNDFLSHNLPWQTMQPIWKKDFLISLGGFNENFKRMQDVELHTRALLTNGVAFKQIIDAADCFYRIDENRKDLNAYNFMSRWVDAAIMYVNHFQLIPVQNKKYLTGTIYETYTQLMLQYKINKITLEEFLLLEKRILNTTININKMQYFLFSTSKFYNLKIPRIPGINKIIKKLIIQL